MPITKEDLIELILEDTVRPVEVDDVRDGGCVVCDLNDPFSEKVRPFKEGYALVLENRLMRRLKKAGILIKPTNKE